MNNMWSVQTLMFSTKKVQQHEKVKFHRFENLKTTMRDGG
jgi:hypothetical protein